MLAWLEEKAMVSGRTLAAHIVVCVLLCSLGCEPKSVSDIPSISGQVEPNRADRNVPDASTMAALLELMDPRGSNIDRLDRQRAEFLQRIQLLLPDPSHQDALGIKNLIRWHRLYTVRLREHYRAIDAVQTQTRALLRPRVGREITVSDNGSVRDCLRPKGVPTPPVTGPFDVQKAPTPAPDCQPRPGFNQIEFQLQAATTEMNAVLEAQWHLVQRIERVRRQLAKTQSDSASPDTSP